MTYDDWKTTDDTPQPEPAWYCEACDHQGRHDEQCGCPCCCEPEQVGGGE